MNPVSAVLTHQIHASPRPRKLRQFRDDFVAAAHHDPATAARMLAQNRFLAGARASWGETAVQAASHLGHRELLARLKHAGAAIDIFAAAAMGDTAAAQAMLPRTAKDACGIHDLPLLHFAVMSRSLAMLEMLLRAGVELNPRGASLSPLHSAVAVGSQPMIQALVSAGVDLAATDAFGATALDWAYEVERATFDALQRIS